MKTSQTLSYAIALASIVAALPLAAAAQSVTASSNATVNTSANTSTSANAGGIRAAIQARGDAHASTSATRSDDAKAKADDALDKRVDSLNKALARLGQMKKLSSDEVASLTTSLNAQISAFTDLKAKIDADADVATLKTDVESITKNYRLYMVVLPQARIVAAADRIQSITSQMTTVESKLQARITEAQGKGKDMSTATSAYADLQAKVSDANVQAAAAVSTTANLKPDQGDATVAASNKTALQSGAAKIKASMADLKAARADIDVIVKAVKGS